MGNYYYLNDDHTCEECDLMTWFDQHEELHRSNKKYVAKDVVIGYIIYTVWLGLNRNLLQENLPPLIFETMVFKAYGWVHDYCARYSTWEEAEAGHKKAVEWVKAGCQHELD